ncbi:MAG: phage late control D family protein [Gammaproteobacteria bacterium]
MARYPRYAPEFSLRIHGEPLPGVLRGSVSSITYQDGLEGADRVEVTIANPGLRWLDHPLLQADNGFKLAIGYAPDPLEEVFVGEITGVEPSFPSGGMPTLKITAQDFLHRLTKGTKDRAFRISIPSIGNFPLPDVAVASIVSGTNLLIPDPDPVGAALSVLMTIATYVVAPSVAQQNVRRQSGTSDFDFLSGIARENGWEVFIDHTAEPRGYRLKFKFIIQDYAPSLTLQWGASLMDFTPRLTTVGDIFGVTSRIWVPSIKTEFVIVVSWDYDRAAFNLSVYPSLIGDIDEVLGPEAAGRTISLKPTGFPQSLREILSELLPRLNNRLTGSGSTIGDPRIKAGRVINFEGLGEQFSGLYRVTSATHSLDSGGYRTSFEARKEVWFGSIPVPKGASGLLRVQGQRVG